MAWSRDPRKPTRYMRGSKRYNDVGGHSPPGDELENTRDHERIWFELKRTRSCCDCEDPGFKYCFQTFDWPQYICDGEFPGGDTMVGYWPGTAELDSSWYIPAGCTPDEIRPANLIVPVSHDAGSWRNGPYSDFTVGATGYQGNLQSAGFNWANFFPDQNRTLEAWIKPSSSDISNGRAFIQQGLAGNVLAHGGLNVYFRSNGALGFEHIEVDGGAVQESGAGWWEADQWHHFVLVRNADTNSIAFFINGRLAISRVLPSTGWDVIEFPATPDIILQWASWADIAYYTSALSPSVIRKHYNSVYGVEGVANPLGSEGTPIEDPTTVITEPITVDFIDGGGSAHTGDIIISQGDFADYVSPEDSPFELEARKGVANGYAPLDASGLLLDEDLGSGTPSRDTFLRGDRAWATGQIVPEPTVDQQMLVAVGDRSTEYQAAVLASSPTYYWPLTEASSPWDDLGANDKDFTPTSDPAPSSVLPVFYGETPLEFDTGDSLTSAATAIANSDKQYTISFFVWINSLPGSTVPLVLRGGSSGVKLQADGKLVSFCSPRADVVSATALVPERWYHVAAVFYTSNFGGGATYRSIIIDGVEDVNVASSQDATLSTNTFTVGGGFDGKIAHVADFEWATLSPATIAAHLATRGRRWIAVDASSIGLALPDTAGYADGDVLTLDAALDPVWETPTGGGGVEVDLNDADVTAAARGRLNFIEGTGIDLTVTDDAANGEVDITIAATGGGGGVEVDLNDADVTAAARGRLNLIEGIGIDLTVTDDAANGEVDITIAATGGGSGVAFAGASVRRTTAYSIPNNSHTIVPFDSEDYDTHGFHDNATNPSRLTVPAGMGGKYLVVLNANMASGAGNTECNIIKNGAVSNTGRRSFGYDSTSYPRLEGAVVLDLVAGDYLELDIYQNTGSAKNVAVNESQPTFSITKLDNGGSIVGTTVAGLGTPTNGTMGLLRVGSSPYEFLPLIYDSTLGKWVSGVVGGTDGSAASATTVSTSYVELQDASSSVRRFFVPNAKALYDAGLRPQLAVFGYLQNSGGGDVTSIRGAIAEAGAGDTAQNVVGTGTDVSNTGTTATFRYQDWETITLAALTDAHWFVEAQMKVSAGTGTIARVAARLRWVSA